MAPDLINPTVGYCTNVHPGTSLEQVKQQLAEHAVRVHELRGKARPLPVGLWFAADVADELARPGAIESFRAWLHEHQLLPYTLNGFPFGNFHEPVVKHRVYEPDWTTPERLEYTRSLAELLAGLIDEGDQGSISTLPIGWPGEPDQDHERLQSSGRQLLQLTETLKEIEDRTGRWVHVNLEPEPGCLLDTADDIVGFFNAHVLAKTDDEENVRRYLGVCHDVCHSAVMFEPQAQAIQKYKAAGLRVGKVQVSAAVAAPFDQMDLMQAREALEQLHNFSEPRYLHQTTRQTAGEVQMVDDLPDALASLEGERPGQLPAEPWRVHFHVPINVAAFGQLQSTQAQIGDCLLELLGRGDTRHLEVETYAWSVLPEAMRTDDLAHGIAKEIAWLDGWLDAWRESGRP